MEHEGESKKYIEKLGMLEVRIGKIAILPIFVANPGAGNSIDGLAISYP